MSDETKPSPAPAARPEPGGRRASQRPKSDIDIAGRLRSAQQALLGRPRFSIRLRLVASLLVCFSLCCGFAVLAGDLLHDTRAKLHLLQAMERLEDRVGVDQAVVSASHVQRVLDAARETEAALRKTKAGVPAADRAILHDLVQQAEASRTALEAQGSTARPTLLAGPQLAGLRNAERAAQHVLSEAIAREREAVDGILGQAEVGAVALVAILLGLFAAITLLFAHALASPIARFKGYTARIAGGDFSFIRPARKYRDEFSDLAVAVNQMLAELRSQQRRVVTGAKLAAVGTLASGIAHELNNPLNNISITTEALMEGLAEMTDEEKWKHLQDIYFETERAGEIVKSLLDFTRKEKPEMVLLDLGEVLESTLRLVQNEMTLHDVTLSCQIPRGLPQVRGAANQLRQVFLNLVLNAIQAMPTGGPLKVSVARHDPERVCVEIHDEGAGIPADVLPRIFDPFFTTKDPGKGTGLGLSVSLGIIRNFGGDIQVASEPGKGTTFHVCLPCADGK